jgi:hypothetical protein
LFVPIYYRNGINCWRLTMLNEDIVIVIYYSIVKMIY